MQQFIKRYFKAFNIMYALELAPATSQSKMTTNAYLWYNNFLLGLLSK